MQKEFIPYELTLEIKALGFNESCFGVYSEFDKTRVYDEQYIVEGLKVPAPTFSQCFRWFREKYGLKISFTYWNGYNGFITRGAYKYECYIIPENDMSITVRGEKGNVYFNTYEEAELACLIKLIQIVKDGNK